MYRIFLQLSSVVVLKMCKRKVFREKKCLYTNRVQLNEEQRRTYRSDLHFDNVSLHPVSILYSVYGHKKPSKNFLGPCHELLRRLPTQKTQEKTDQSKSTTVTGDSRSFLLFSTGALLL